MCGVRYEGHGVWCVMAVWCVVCRFCFSPHHTPHTTPTHTTHLTQHHRTPQTSHHTTNHHPTSHIRATSGTPRSCATHRALRRRIFAFPRRSSPHRRSLEQCLKRSKPSGARPRRRIDGLLLTPPPVLFARQLAQHASPSAPSLRRTRRVSSSKASIRVRVPVRDAGGENKGLECGILLGLCLVR